MRQEPDPKRERMGSIAKVLRGDGPMEEKKRALAEWDEMLGLEPSEVTDQDVEFFLREVLGLEAQELELVGAYRQGLEALGRISDTSKAMEVPYRTLQARRLGQRGVSPEAALQLASYLRTRSRRLSKMAVRLATAAGREAANV